MRKLFISRGKAAYYGCASSSTQVRHFVLLMKYKNITLKKTKKKKNESFILLSYLCRQQATTNTNKTTTTTNSNKYRNSALFLEQKRLAVQKNLRQLQESSISRDVIRSKITDLLCALYILFFFLLFFFFSF